MKIAAVLGSPRKGMNSETLAETFLKEAESLGAKVKRFRLSDMKYQGCTACDGCKTTSEKCVLDDDMIPLLEAVRNSDTLLLATPIYFNSAPAQVKGFIDRWFSFFKPNYIARNDKIRLPGGKNVVFVVTQGAPETAFMEFIQTYDRIFTMFGFSKMHLIRGCQLRNEPNTASNRPELLEKAKETARRVMSGKPSDWNMPS